MPILGIEQIRLAETENGNIVTLFAYDDTTNEGICGVFNMSKKKFEFGKKSLHNLRILNVKEMNSILTEEKDPTGNYRFAVEYLMEIGINKNIWDNSWSTFQWENVQESEQKYNFLIKKGDHLNISLDGHLKEPLTVKSSVMISSKYIDIVEPSPTSTTTEVSHFSDEKQTNQYDHCCFCF